MTSHVEKGAWRRCAVTGHLPHTHLPVPRGGERRGDRGAWPRRAHRSSRAADTVRTALDIRYSILEVGTHGQCAGMVCPESNAQHGTSPSGYENPHSMGGRGTLSPLSNGLHPYIYIYIRERGEFGTLNEAPIYIYICIVCLHP